MSQSSEAVVRLRREREPGWFPWRSVCVLATAGAVSIGVLVSGDEGAGATNRLANLGRFLREDAMPGPLREGAGPTALLDWLGHWWTAGAGRALAATLGIALVATVLAAAGGALLALLGSRELARPEPFVGPPDRVRGLVSLSARAWALLARAVPEYILAYLLLALFGANAWPAVLALALHNAGILGRLGGEAIEDLERRPLQALTLAGTRRDAVAMAGVAPAVFGRYLLFVLYRLETCLREATVLGMVGIASIGAAVQEARARQRYDELLLLLASAGLTVLAVDLASRRLRRWLKASGA
ncbi:MAG: ABC transporter permease subunit [Planctomycetota bacterium]